MIVIALGANLPSMYGSPEETLRAALRALEARGVRVVAASSVWLSAPVPVSEQPWYRNAAAVVETTLEIPALLRLLKGVEAQFGRALAQRNAPRVLDMDIISYHDAVHDAGGVIVPHPRMEGRAFVLYPLAEIAPGWVHPVSGVSVDVLLRQLPGGQAIERLEDFRLREAA